MDESRRTLLKATAALLVDQWAAARLGALAAEPSAGAGRKVVVLTCGGIRREDSLPIPGSTTFPISTWTCFRRAPSTPLCETQASPPTTTPSPASLAETGSGLKIGERHPQQSHAL
jgi:hypothetical protein